VTHGSREDPKRRGEANRGGVCHGGFGGRGRDARPVPGQTRYRYARGGHEAVSSRVR
jgi:hypothetical protein